MIAEQLEMISSEVLKEAHALLWSAPLMNNGILDAGWNCRDHAIVFIALLKILGKDAAIAHGKNMLVKGPGPNSHPMGYGQDSTHGHGHTWILASPDTIFDYSLRLPDAKLGKKWKGLKDPVVEAGVCRTVDNADVILTRSAQDYENEIAIGTRAQGSFRVVYLLVGTEIFRPEMLMDPFAWIDSPLSNKIVERYTRDIYIKLVMHLHDLAKDRVRSIAHKSQTGAWNTIARRQTDDVETFFRLMDA